MGLSRKKLKAIIKECLVEILSEGLNTVPNNNTINKSILKTSQKKVKNLDNAITSTISSITNDSVMASIFEDTARTTLQEQYSAESSTPKQAGVNIDEFENFNDWSTLAFSDKDKK
tara:strand:- start:622 stop:969 length:348 start_codon:yes stop_codon:yes gene_type:complete